MFALTTFIIRRLTIPPGAGTGSRRRSFQPTGGMITGFLGTANAEYTAIVDGEFGKTFSLASDDIETDIRIGDRITSDDIIPVEYEVKGVIKNEQAPGRGIEIICTLPVQQ